MTMLTNGDENKIHSSPGTVNIPPELWLVELFQKHKEMLRAMNNGKIFECTHGEITINIHEGHVQSISVKNRTYQHTSPVVLKTKEQIPRALP